MISIFPLVLVTLPVLDAESKTPSFKLLEPLSNIEPAPELKLKLPVVAIPATPTPLA